MFEKQPSSKKRAATVREVKDWARAALSLPEEAVVMATELRCTEPGCPPLETIIAILPAQGERQQFKIHKPLDEVGRADVEAGAAQLLCAGGDARGDDAPSPPR